MVALTMLLDVAQTSKSGPKEPILPLPAEESYIGQYYSPECVAFYGKHSTKQHGGPLFRFDKIGNLGRFIFNLQKRMLIACPKCASTSSDSLFESAEIEAATRQAVTHSGLTQRSTSIKAPSSCAF